MAKLRRQKNKKIFREKYENSSLKTDKMVYSN
jgi:hypothetical protein